MDRSVTKVALLAAVSALTLGCSRGVCITETQGMEIDKQNRLVPSLTKTDAYCSGGTTKSQCLDTKSPRELSRRWVPYRDEDTGGTPGAVTCGAEGFPYRSGNSFRRTR